MLSLTDSQMELVTDVAKHLPPHARDQFLRSLASRLDDVDWPSDGQLISAIEFLLSTKGISIDLRPPRRHKQTKRQENANQTPHPR
jgi:hypothetical protein